MDVGGVAVGKPGHGEGPGLGSPPAPGDRTTCEGSPRPGGKMVSLLAYTSLDLVVGVTQNKQKLFSEKIISR